MKIEVKKSTATPYEESKSIENDLSGRDSAKLKPKGTFGPQASIDDTEKRLKVNVYAQESNDNNS